MIVSLDRIDKMMLLSSKWLSTRSCACYINVSMFSLIVCWSFAFVNDCKNTLLLCVSYTIMIFSAS